MRIGIVIVPSHIQTKAVNEIDIHGGIGSSADEIHQVDHHIKVDGGIFVLVFEVEPVLVISSLIPKSVNVQSRTHI